MKTVYEVVAGVLGVPPEQITDATTPASIDTWDSYNALLMVSELETNFNVTFTLAEVRSVTCVKDIKDILRTHGVAIPD